MQRSLGWTKGRRDRVFSILARAVIELKLISERFSIFNLNIDQEKEDTF